MSINPDVLAWAMDQAGISVVSLSESVHVSDELVGQWLSGAGKPSTTELRNIAKALRRPTSVFFLPRPPQSSHTAVAFRAPLGKRGAREITPDELNEIRQASRRQKIVDWIKVRADDEGPMILPPAQQTPEATALVVQSWLAWNIDLQVKATSKSAVTKMLRTSLEDRGSPFTGWRE